MLEPTLFMVVIRSAGKIKAYRYFADRMDVLGWGLVLDGSFSKCSGHSEISLRLPPPVLSHRRSVIGTLTGHLEYTCVHSSPTNNQAED